MRILHIYKDYYPVLGGIENHIKMLAEGQAARGDQVSVLVTSRDRHTHTEGMNGVHVIFAGRLATISSAPISTEMLRLVHAEQPDVAHLHFPYPWGEFAELLRGRAGKTVLTYHSDIVRQKYLRVAYAPMLRRVLARARTLIATSPNYIESSPVLRRYRAKCVVIPLGIDPEPFLNVSPRAARQMRERLVGSEFAEQPLLIFVGRLRYYKGLNYLLQALALVSGVHLAVVGSGPMEAEWRELAQRLGITSRVHFAGEVPDADLPACYAAGDVFVLPASERSEAFGAVQLEAMASSLPVISADVGTGVAWVNQDGVTGLVVPPRHPAALAGAVRQLTADRETRLRMGLAGRERVLAEFTSERMIERVYQVYRA